MSLIPLSSRVSLLMFAGGPEASGHCLLRHPRRCPPPRPLHPPSLLLPHSQGLEEAQQRVPDLQEPPGGGQSPDVRDHPPGYLLDPHPAGSGRLQADEGKLVPRFLRCVQLANNSRSRQVFTLARLASALVCCN